MNNQQDQSNYRSTLIPNAVLFNKRGPSRKGIICPLSGKDAPVIDYKNIALLTKYVSEKGRILPSRITNVSAKKQRQLKDAINKARTLALLPFSAK